MTPKPKSKAEAEKNLNEKFLRVQVLEDAMQCITKDRQATHGKPENNFANIANLWNAYLNMQLTTHDVAMMMVLLKAARFKGNPTYIDNCVDMAGYAALAVELAVANTGVA